MRIERIFRELTRCWRNVYLENHPTRSKHTRSIGNSFGFFCREKSKLVEFRTFIDCKENIATVEQIFIDVFVDAFEFGFSFFLFFFFFFKIPKGNYVNLSE